MKSLLKNKWFWILVAAAIVVTFIVARSSAGNSISSATTKIIPLGKTDTAPAATKTA